MADGALTVTPNVNLVENVGFRHDATHTLRTPAYLRSVQAMSLPTAPVEVALDHRADDWLMRHVYRATVPGLVGQAVRAARELTRSR